jgi:serine/threonine protein kinase
MGLQLVVIEGPDKGRAFALTPNDWILVGRSRATETQLNDPCVSKVHCKVEWTARGVIVTDQGSTSGTRVNGQCSVDERVLHPGDVIGVGGTSLRLLDDSAPAADLAEGQTLALPAAAKGPAPAQTELSKELTGKSLSHYVLGSLLARGASGLIFQALDTQNNRRVAVKVLSPDFIHNDVDVQRFVRAMRTMLPLRHPNLVAIYGAGKSGTYCWCAMEYVEGENLAQVIDRQKTARVHDWRPALRYAVHIARALDRAHQNHIIHRNLTPANVIIRASDQVAKLGDLMLAKALEGLLAEKITRPGDIVGDVRFLSPEATTSAANADARSDLFALGSVTYAALLGQPPFEGSSAVDTMIRIRDVEPVPPRGSQPGIPAAFEACVLKLLHKQPENRYQTAAELLAELEEIASAHGVAL